jgi:hypothetical protein
LLKVSDGNCCELDKLIFSAMPVVLFVSSNPFP